MRKSPLSLFDRLDVICVGYLHGAVPLGSRYFHNYDIPVIITLEKTSS